MKITKTTDRVNYLKEKRRKANEGCDKCPCCGKEYFGIPTIIHWATWFFGWKYWERSCYQCSCGCEWESEIYETK